MFEHISFLCVLVLSMVCMSMRICGLPQVFSSPLLDSLQASRHGQSSWRKFYRPHIFTASASIGKHSVDTKMPHACDTWALLLNMPHCKAMRMSRKCHLLMSTAAVCLLNFKPEVNPKTHQAPAGVSHYHEALQGLLALVTCMTKASDSWCIIWIIHPKVFRKLDFAEMGR